MVVAHGNINVSDLDAGVMGQGGFNIVCIANLLEVENNGEGAAHANRIGISRIIYGQRLRGCGHGKAY